MTDHPKSESRSAIVVAILGNVAIAVTKFFAAFMTGSSAMISEGIHSFVDTGNGALMLLGLRQSQKPPDAEHPFGYGKELYFWSLIVSFGIFAVGCGMSVYEGLTHLFHPEPIRNAFWNYVVLGFAFLFEGISWMFGWRVFRVAKGRRGILQAIHESKDPSTFLVFLEDSAALTGLVIAAVGIFFGRLLNNPYVDGVASVLIGLLLGMISVFLARESKGLLIGEGVDNETLDRIRQLVEADADVDHVHRVLTMYFGPQEVLLTLEVKFHDELSAVGVREAVARLHRAVRQQHPEINRVFFGSESLAHDGLAE